MKLLLDQNLSHRMLNPLLPYFPQSTQVALLELDRAQDQQIWEYARINNFVIVTKDSDFQELSILHGSPPKVIWLKCGNQSRQAITDLLIGNRQNIEQLIKDNDILEIY